MTEVVILGNIGKLRCRKRLGNTAKVLWAGDTPTRVKLIPPSRPLRARGYN